MPGNTTATKSADYPRYAPPPPAPRTALAILWSRLTPAWTGSIAELAEERVNVVARDLDLKPVRFVIASPVGVRPVPPLSATKVSRKHFEIAKQADGTWTLTPRE